VFVSCDDEVRTVRSAEFHAISTYTFGVIVARGLVGTFTHRNNSFDFPD
jgi:hypothetical protein